MKHLLHPVARVLLCLIFVAHALAASAIGPGIAPAPGDTTFISPNLCPGDSVVINGMVFNQQHSYGVQVFPHAKVDGTDSILSIHVVLLMPGENFVIQTYCSNHLLIINHHIYDAANPVGEEVIPHGAANGCDSLIHIKLTFAPTPEYNLVQTICTGDTILVGQTPYHAGFFVGTEVLKHGSWLGCDSTVHVHLTVLPVPVDTLDVRICPEDSLIVNGTVYNIHHIVGTEYLANAALNGCDSMVVVRLKFYQKPANYLGPDQQLGLGDTLCLHVNLPFTPDKIEWLTKPPCPTLPCFEFCEPALYSDVYVAQITAPVNCILTDTLTVRVDRGRHIFTGNVFQPGSGAPNDRFFVQTDHSVRRIHWVKVFDRWGELMFETTGGESLPYTAGWDGKWKGQPAAPGVYAWAMEVEYVDGVTEIRTGDVALVR
jgi:hypothetical protein